MLIETWYKNFSFKVFYLSISFVLLLSLIGCAGFTSPARKHVLENNVSYWFDYDASRRGAFIFPDSQKIKVCAEPSPDVALQILDKFALKVPVENIPISGEVNVSQEIIQLAGRGQSLLFLREALYRLCELSLNNEFTKDELLDVYKEVIKISSDLSKAELINAEANLIKEKARLFEIRKHIDQKINAIIEYVNDSGMVNKDKLMKLIKDTVVEKIFGKFYGKPVEEFKSQIETRYLEYIDLLYERLKINRGDMK